MSAKGIIDHGDLFRITGGSESVGEIGEVFWIGHSRFNAQLRVGIELLDYDEKKSVWVDAKNGEVIEPWDGTDNDDDCDEGPGISYPREVDFGPSDFVHPMDFSGGDRLDHPCDW